MVLGLGDGRSALWPAPGSAPNAGAGAAPVGAAEALLKAKPVVNSADIAGEVTALKNGAALGAAAAMLGAPAGHACRVLALKGCMFNALDSRGTEYGDRKLQMQARQLQTHMCCKRAWQNGNVLSIGWMYSIHGVCDPLWDQIPGMNLQAPSYYGGVYMGGSAITHLTSRRRRLQRVPPPPPPTSPPRTPRQQTLAAARRRQPWRAPGVAQTLRSPLALPAPMLRQRTAAALQIPPLWRVPGVARASPPPPLPALLARKQRPQTAAPLLGPPLLTAPAAERAPPLASAPPPRSDRRPPPHPCPRGMTSAAARLAPPRARAQAAGWRRVLEQEGGLVP